MDSRFSGQNGGEGAAAWHDPIMIGSGLALLAATSVLAADGTSLIERWRGLGPVLWLAAAGAAALWVLLLGVFMFATRCRDIDPGPSTLDLGGPEPPALVNLLTSGWRLGHEAVPATLLDLGARRLLGIEQVGEQTLVRIRPASDRTRERTKDLEPYERMVLDHVVAHATDGVIPAEALTTGPEDEAKGWWKRFRKSVERDARNRGLSRRRWSPGVRITLAISALVVAVCVGVAATTLPDDPDKSDDDPLGAALAFSLMTAGTLMVLGEAPNRERDTRVGREAASRWLGLRTLLSEDPLFAEYPPAGVAIWDRLLAYGATMGVAHGAVRALPLGAERDDEAWSPVGGHWRVVRIRYPNRIPPGYGRHPGLVTFLGLIRLALAGPAVPAASAAADGLRDLVVGNSADKTVPAGFQLGVGIALGVIVAGAALLAVQGLVMVVAGFADLATRHRPIEGRVLRVRRRGDDDNQRWYVAVDDGTADRIRAWKTLPGGAAQAATVGAEVTRCLAHVRNLTVVTPAPAKPSLPEDEIRESTPLSALLGTVDLTGGTLAPGTAWTPIPVTAGPSPPLPDAATVSAAAGRPLDVDPAASAHPLAQDGRSVSFVGAGGATLHVAWVDPNFLQAHRSMPRFLRRELSGVGDEAYRAVIGGGVVARRGGHVLLVMGRLPGFSDSDRNRAFEEVARAAVNGSGGAG